jgi:hypothetical protein
VPAAGVVEHPVQLEVGVGAEGQPAVQLEHEPLAEHDRGVRLLGAERAHGQVAPQRERVPAVRLESEVDIAQPLVAGDQPEQLEGNLGVSRGVVYGQLAEGADRPLGGSPAAASLAERELVELWRPVGEAHLGDHQYAQRSTDRQPIDERHGAGDPHLANRPALAAEPTLARQPCRDHWRQVVRWRGHDGSTLSQ